MAEATPTKSPDDVDRSKDLSDDIDLDFEEISDGELEEEARSKGIGDALGVDWSSLVEESKAMMRDKLTKNETPAKHRWHPDQILIDIGISYKMAGAVFAHQTLVKAHEHLKRTAKASVTIKTEPMDDSNHVGDNKEVKVNGKCGTNDDDARQIIFHPLPCVQTSGQSASDRQRQLIFNASGPYSRGLCTRRDIEMRRQLCKLSINETNCKTVTTKTGYESIALKLFQKALQT